ncbi:hypothetical protein NDU88_006962 [Pleurodeles waltl]|uniref:Uncharacterized protein n=1 Tax=Pleurodeles waltl TaxID=8319 RepID=A0AAV7WEV0_PLEWA|nr:hypothetical protein NDU88_006962 [Pleurodeles waltl]
MRADGFYRCSPPVPTHPGVDVPLGLSHPAGPRGSVSGSLCAAAPGSCPDTPAGPGCGCERPSLVPPLLRPPLPAGGSPTAGDSAALVLLRSPDLRQGGGAAGS